MLIVLNLLKTAQILLWYHHHNYYNRINNFTMWSPNSRINNSTCWLQKKEESIGFLRGEAKTCSGSRFDTQPNLYGWCYGLTRNTIGEWIYWNWGFQRWKDLVLLCDLHRDLHPLFHHSHLIPFQYLLYSIWMGRGMVHWYCRKKEEISRINFLYYFGFVCLLQL